MTESIFEDVEVQQREEVPSLADFRRTVDTLTNFREAAIIKLLYLGGFRCSEVVTRVTPWERGHQTTRAYGRALTCSFADWELNGKKEKILLIKALTAKLFRKRK